MRGIIIDENFTGQRIVQGDALPILQELPDAVLGGVITDPPYSSGAADLSARQKGTAEKYTNIKRDNPMPDFEGDAKDQRSWTRWMAEILSEARRAAKVGAPICVFIDWRQLPALTDALQWAGWVWRGVSCLVMSRWERSDVAAHSSRLRSELHYLYEPPAAWTLSPAGGVCRVG